MPPHGKPPSSVPRMNDKIASIVITGLMSELRVQRAEPKDDLRKDLRLDNDDLDEFVEKLLIKLGVNPYRINTASFGRKVKSVEDLVEFVGWCYSR